MTEKIEALCAGGFRAAMDLIAPAFKEVHGVDLAFTYATPAKAREYLEAGFPFDAGVIVAGVLKKAQADGFVAGLENFKLAVSPVGWGVRAGEQAPTVSTMRDFRAALAAVGRLGLSDPKAGTMLGAETMAHADRLGIGDEMRAKVVYINGPGSQVSAAVARGEADAVITLASEIAPIPGIRLAGRLPDEMQTEYSMQALASAEAPAAARALLAFLRGDEARDIMRRIGLEPVAADQGEDHEQ